MARRLRRYKFAGIKKLSRTQVRVQNALLRYLPATTFGSGFKDELREVIEPLVHVDVDFWLESVTPVAGGTIARHLATPPCIAVVGMLPKTEKVLFEVGLTLAQQAIDRMLGGDASDIDAQRALSEIEEGVFSFLLLKILNLIQTGFGAENQIGFKLEEVVGNLEDLKQRADLTDDYVCLAFKLFFDVDVGFCRVFVPSSLIARDVSTAAPEPGPALERTLRELALRAYRIAAIKTDLRVNLGTINLTNEDLDGLEVEDIVLVESSEVQMSGGAVAGRVQCVVGNGQTGVLNGSLMVGESENYEVAIDEILRFEEPPSEGEMADEQEYVEEEAVDEEHAENLSRRGLAAAPKAVFQPARAHVAPHQNLARVAIEDEAHGEEFADEEYEEPAEGEYADEEGGEDEAPLAEAANLLGDIGVKVVVELGRVAVTAADVVQLRPGQIIELSRSPRDPVDLVVDNRRIGRGELVEIEGELGVRILSISR